MMALQRRTTRGVQVRPRPLLRLRRAFSAGSAAPALVLLAAALLAAGPGDLRPLSAQELQHPSPELAVPHFAWEAGDYVRSLEGYLSVLQAPGGEEHLREIALRTGEWYEVAELSVDGRNVAFAPDGNAAVYQTVEDGRVVTHVVDLSGSGGAWMAGSVPPSVSLPSGITGTGAPTALGVGGRLAMVEVSTGPVVDAARTALARALDTGDRDLIAAARSALAEAEAGSAVLRVGRASAPPAAGGSGGTLSVVEAPGLTFGGATPLVWAPDVPVLVVGGQRTQASGEVVSELLVHLEGEGRLDPVPNSTNARNPRFLPGGRVLLWEGVTSTEERGPDGGLRSVASVPVLHARDLQTGEGWSLQGDAWTVSTDGRTAAFLREGAGQTHLGVVSLDPGGLDRSAPTPRMLATFSTPVAAPALSPDGSRVAYQRMPRDDWEIFVRPTTGAARGAGGGAGGGAPGDVAPGSTWEPADELPVTIEVQHDILPRFLDNSTLMAVKGEARHRRAYSYALETGEWEKLFHNNTVRTIAPEYEWAASSDGRFLLFVADRDGNTVSPERGVYLLDRSRTVDRQAVLQRLRQNLEREQDLARFAEERFGPLEARVRPVTEAVSVDRIFAYARDLYGFGSKHISQPGNARAVEYLTETLRGWGYEPELQWFEPRPGIRTANVIAELPGTTDPDLIYIVSSHFDSHVRGPGADDNSSGTTALLEAARVLRDHPQPATLHFAFFTGEESGLLGSREYVRRAEAARDHVAGALNNDMVGWVNDARLDNTIRYSSPGIRDIQHAAARRFSRLITYDALYYRSTDAAAFYEAWGDIVGGIGSYPVLGNPNYHQFGDRLETIHQPLVAEVSRTTVASLMLLASTPSRPTGLALGDRRGWQVDIGWDRAPEIGVERYSVQITRTDGTVEVHGTEVPSFRVDAIQDIARIEVRSVGAGGVESRDAAVLTFP